MSLSAKFSTTSVDLRFDQSDRTVNGHLVNSLEAVKPVIDRIKANGFDAVTLQTNIPIDVKTGAIDLWAEELQYNQDKSIPDDYWKIVDYAKSIGLQVIVKAEIVNSLNDGWINQGTNLGNNWSWTKFFESVTNYEASLSLLAQQHKVDGFYVGYNNNGITGENFRSQWQHIVDVVRQNFKGSLLYSADYNQKSVVWDMVDIVGICANPVLSTTALTDVEEIISRYSVAEAGYRSNIVEAFNSIYQQYKKPIIYDGLSIQAGDKVIGDMYNNQLWNSLFTTGSVDNSRFELNYDRQVLRYKAALELIANELRETVDAISVGEYSPWQSANWIVNNATSPWGLYSQLGINLLNSPKTEALFSEYFNQAWGYKTLWYGTAANDTIVSQSGNDLIYGYQGNDTIDGGAGKDTVTVSNSINNYSVTKTATGYTLVDKTGSNGTDTLLNIEAIKFSDKTINLTVQAKAASAPQADVTRLVELYTAFFNRVPDADGMSFWIDAMKSGKTINQISNLFYDAGVNYSSLTGFTATMKNTDFINVIYKNVLGRKDGADAGGLSFWDGALNSGQASRGTLVTNILDSAHTCKGDATWGWVADLLDNKITVAKKFSIDMGLNYNTTEESITKGMAIVGAITPTDTTAAITLIGVDTWQSFTLMA